MSKKDPKDDAASPNSIFPSLSKWIERQQKRSQWIKEERAIINPFINALFQCRFLGRDTWFPPTSISFGDQEHMFPPTRLNIRELPIVPMEYGEECKAFMAVKRARKKENNRGLLYAVISSITISGLSPAAKNGFFQYRREIHEKNIGRLKDLISSTKDPTKLMQAREKLQQLKNSRFAAFSQKLHRSCNNPFGRFVSILFLEIPVGIAMYNYATDYTEYYNHIKKIPLVSGRSSLSDSTCNHFIGIYRSIPQQDFDKHLNNNTTKESGIVSSILTKSQVDTHLDIDTIHHFVANCLRRQQMEKDIRSKARQRQMDQAQFVNFGVGANSLFPPIPQPGVPPDTPVKMRLDKE